jgi:hypothetical protein
LASHVLSATAERPLTISSNRALRVSECIDELVEGPAVQQ